MIPSPLLAGIRLSEQVAFNGAVLGMVYGILAIGIILVFRSSGVINFAHAQLGIVGAVLLAKMVIDWNWPFLLALAVVVPLGGLIGAVVELVVIRRLFDAPRVVVFVATLGVAQILTFAALQIPRIRGFAAFPTPSSSRWRWAGVDVRADQLVAVVVTAVVGLLLAWFFGRTTWGTAVRAGAANPEATRLAGISVRSLSTSVWAITGVLATITVIVSAPLRSTQVQSLATDVGTGLLLRALAVALLARLSSMPVALGAGAVFGVVESVLLFNYPAAPGLSDVVLLIVVLAGVLTVADNRSAVSTATESTWTTTTSRRPEPGSDPPGWIAGHLPGLAATLAIVCAVALPLIFDEPSRHFLYARVAMFAIVALSVSVLTGWAGQVSLGQFTFAGLGAFTVAGLDAARLQFVPAVLLATVVVVVAAIVVGLPALRVRGLQLAVATLAFAGAADAWLFEQPLFTGSGARARIEPSHLLLGPLDLRSKRTFYYVALAMLVLAFMLVGRLERSGIGRSLVAIRNNESCAAAYGISPVRAKLVAFAIGGGLAGIAGALYGGLLTQFDSAAFTPGFSIQVVAIAVIGGLGSRTGAVLGTLWVVGLPALFGDSTNVTLLTSGAGLLILLLYFPGGLVAVAHMIRRGLAAVLPRGPESVAERRPVTHSPVVTAPHVHHETDAPPLVVRDLTVEFGANTALDDASIRVEPGEIVGLIGANGAGKSTLMNAIGGHVESHGQVELFGHDVSGRSINYRARLGLGRAFQNAELFSDLTVLETVALGGDTRRPTSLARVLTGAPGWRATDRAQRAHAADLIDYLGLGRFADQSVAHLSTGTRRITELAALLAFGPSLICLDEPTAGVAQRETEAFGPLLQRIRQDLDAAVLLIEHDMPLVMAVSDRMYCLESGVIIAEGLPAAVRSDPAVVASYLGTDERAINRSTRS